MKRLCSLTVCVTLFYFTSCTNPFDVRTPDPPGLGDDQTCAHITLTGPESLLPKIDCAFESNDTPSYMETLSDSLLVSTGFDFVPEEDEASRLTGWTRSDEESYFFNLIDQEGLERILFEFSGPDNWVEVATSPDTLQGQFTYLITLEFGATDEFRTKTEFYQGRSIVSIFKSSAQLWYIFSWEDLKTDGDSTWSTLKANLRF